MTVLPSRFVEEPAPAIACCFGKERFDTPQRAYDMLRSRKATGPEVYRCPHCRFWHLGRRG